MNLRTRIGIVIFLAFTAGVSLVLLYIGEMDGAAIAAMIAGMFGGFFIREVLRMYNDGSLNLSPFEELALLMGGLFISLYIMFKLLPWKITFDSTYKSTHNWTYKPTTV